MHSNEKELRKEEFWLHWILSSVLLLKKIIRPIRDGCDSLPLPELVAFTLRFRLRPFDVLSAYVYDLIFYNMVMILPIFAR